MQVEDLRVAIYADGAAIDGMLRMRKRSYIKGFTTNPSLMRKAGVKDYAAFAEEVTDIIPDLPISFEVFADDFKGMKREALTLSGFGKNVYVKIPIMNSKGASSAPLIAELSEMGVSLNVTAVFTLEQVKKVLESLAPGTRNIVSVFAGRIADTGVDPEPIMRETADLCKTSRKAWSLWASCREVFNIMQADRCGVDIITVTNAILEKLGNLGKNLDAFSLETVQMFERDGRSLGVVYK